MKMKMKVYEPVSASISLLLYRILYLFCVTSDTMSLFKYEMKISERDIFSKFLLYYKLISINIVINIRSVRIIWSCGFSSNRKNETTISKFNITNVRGFKCIQFQNLQHVIIIIGCTKFFFTRYREDH